MIGNIFVMEANCTDCDKFLPKINYVRDVRLSYLDKIPTVLQTFLLNEGFWSDSMYCVPRDPLCKSCWEKSFCKIS